MKPIKCSQCDDKFRNGAEYRVHWLNNHLPEELREGFLIKEIR